MRFKKIVSLLCIASLIASQGSVAAVSYLSESEDTPTAETEVVENEKTKVYIGGIDSKQEKFEENLLNHIKDNITIKSKTYDGTTNAEVDFSGVELKVESKDSNNVIISDKLTLAATAEFDDKNAGKGKTVTIKNFTLKKIEKTDVNEDESTDVNQAETTDVNENESTDADQTETADDINADDYELDIPEGFSVKIENAADISQKEIILEPVDDVPHYTEDKYPVTLYNKAVTNDEVMDSDNVKIEKEQYKIYIIKTDNQYIYSFNDTADDQSDVQRKDFDLNNNYSLVINPESKPTVNEPDQPIINAAVVTTINDEQAKKTNENATILNSDSSAIYANGNVKLTLSAITKQPYSVKFIVTEDGAEEGDVFFQEEVPAEKGIENTDENNYIFKTEFDVKIPDGQSCYNVKLNCTADNGTESKNTQLKYKLSTDSSDKEPVSTLILDNQAPSFEQVPVYDQEGNIKTDEQGKEIYTDNIKVKYNIGVKDENGNINYHNVQVTGAVTDNLSGVAKIEYQWDNDDDKKYTSLDVDKNNSPEKDNTVSFEFSTSYDDKDFPKTSSNGVHTLYLRITDNAGNVYTTNGTFCEENDGMDTEAPYVEKAYIDIEDGTDNWFKKLLEYFDIFGILPTNKTTTFKFDVKDRTESKKNAGIATVEIIYDENQSITLNKNSEGLYVFSIPENKNLSNIK